MQHDNTQNQREFSRVAIPVRVEVLFDGEAPLTGQAHDLSLNGVLLLTDQIKPVGSICSVHILLGDESPIVIRAEGEVARSNPAGMAVRFRAIEMDSLRHMRNLVLYNASEPEVVEQEFSRHLGIGRRN